MNQILNTEPIEKIKKKRSGPVELSKVILIFSIILILFGIACIVQGAYAMSQNKQILSKIAKEKQTEEAQKPDVTITGDESSGKVEIKGTVPKGVQKIEYQWQGAELQTINKNGETQIDEKIDLASGNGTLTVNIIDKNNATTKLSKTFTADPALPQVNVEQVNGKIRITASDTTELAYVKYKWDNGEETQINPDPNAKAKITQEIDANVSEGTHVLTVIAVNTQNKTKQIQKEIQAASKPEVLVTVNSNDKSHIIFSAKDASGLKYMKFWINNQPYNYNISENDNPKSVQYSFEVTPGNYVVKVEAQNIYGITTTSEEKKYNYTN